MTVFSSILKTEGTKIVDASGKQVILKGAGLGGVLNMENFITGYSGHETEHKQAIEEVLGKEKTDFFFDRFYDYFWTEADAEFYAGMGLNTLRIPFNYRHFFDDDAPSVIKPSGFALLDRMVKRCAKYGIYVVLDLHAVPGGQNQDWHSDSAIHQALFWVHKDFQDRVVNLWVEIAKHYKGDVRIAGYNPVNEPADPEHTRLWAFYVRVEKAIREVDPDHILFLDGNTYAGDFSHFGKPLPNTVYAIHDYALFGFPGFEQYENKPEQYAKLVRQFERKVKVANEANVPVWNGEFGPVYEPETVYPGAPADIDVKENAATNVKRYNMLAAQLKIYKESSVSWSIWTYKDVGIQGLVSVSPDSPWYKKFGDFIEKKKRLGADFWGAHPDPSSDALYDALAEHFKKEIPEKFHKKMYPPLWDIKRQITRVSREIVLSSYLCYEYADLFTGLTEPELDELAKSFCIENCVKRDLLNKFLAEDAASA
ncbi:glycoside hydrolase family 5 protein [Myxozyma melibiosi]|uniref:Glycoside hydrolase family 5 protein n=1 Tax=Myxozyma melibiosi TaxID=54550 RepID=A0ABR1F3X6_9ASCO